MGNTIVYSNSDVNDMVDKKENSVKRSTGRKSKRNSAKNKKNRNPHAATERRKNELNHPGMIPDPDYSDSGEEEVGENGQSRQRVQPCPSGPANGAHFSEDGLVLPKKLSNPCVESAERQKLHKELLFNQKSGKNVLRQKTELEKAVERFQEGQRKKELDEVKLNNLTPFEKKLEEQALKLRQQEEKEELEKCHKAEQPEFLSVRSRICPNATSLDS